MGNCLVTKLKSVVNNDGLVKMQEFKICFKDSSSYPTTGDYVATVTPTDDAIDKLPNMTIHNGYFVVNDQNVTTTTYGSKSVVLTGPGAYISLENKYKVKGLRLNYMSMGVDKMLPEFDYMEGMREVNMPSKISEDVSNTLANLLKKDYLTTLSCNSTNLVFSIDTISNTTKLTNLNIRGCYNVTGDIANLGGNKNLENLHVNGTSISGSLESLVVRMATTEGANTGRTSGSMAMETTSSYVTFNGVAFLSDTISVTWNNGAITVTNNGTTVGTYNGSTWTYA